MGNHMARNLVSKGYPVLVYDVNTAAVDGLKQAGKYSSNTFSFCIRVDHLINIFFLFYLGLSVLTESVSRKKRFEIVFIIQFE